MGQIGRTGQQAAIGSGGRRIAGNIAARIDRLPLTRTQYGLAALTQLFWGLLIATDGIVSRIYPFVWLPRHLLTPLQFNLILLANIGLGILIGEYSGGALSDRFGRKRVLLGGTVVTGLFLWPVALTNSFGWLFFWNLLFGIGIGMMLATNAVYLHEIAPPGTRQRLAQRTQLVAVVPSLVYTSVLAAVLLPAHYQLLLYILAGTVLVVLIPLGTLLLPESPRWLESKLRVTEADAIVSRWERTIEARRGPLPPPVEERHPVVATERVPLREIFSGVYARRSILLLVGWFFGYSGMIYSAVSYIPSYLALHGWSAAQTFTVLILGAPAAVVAFWITAQVGERVERRTLILFAGVAFAAVFLLFLAVESKVGQGVLVVLTYPLGVVWLFNMYNYTSCAYPTRLRSVGTGWTDGIGHLGSITAPLVAGTLFFATVGQNMYGWILWVALPGALLPALLVGLGGMRQRGGILEELAT